MFLACGLLALVGIPAWVWVYTAQLPLWGALPAQLWHAHEMLFGFALAAIAGFLLTAVPSWTGQRGAGGLPLVLLSSVWLLARGLLALGPGPSWWLATIVELAVPTLLLALIAPPLLRTKNRNRVLLVALAGLWLVDAVFMLAIARGDVLLASTALRVALDVALLMITIVGGRIIPSFTANALRGRTPARTVRSQAWIEALLPAVMAANAIVDAFAPSGVVALVIAVAASVLHAWRMAGWQGLRTLRQPILWSLHLAYAWLPLGFVLKAIDLGTDLPIGTFWLHAFGAGAAATMVLAVTTRVSLGHTGRPLVVAPAVAVAYGLLALAAAVRVFLPHLDVLDYSSTLALAALLWSGAFLIFVAVYGPILLTPRIDGKSG